MTALLAHVASDLRGGVNPVLWDVADTLLARGVRVVGTVQRDTPGRDARRCEMDVRVLPGGPVIRISQPLGPAARGCRLDPQGLEEAVALTTARLAAGADLLIVNKFGKHEAEGRGFRETIAAALAMGVPVLVGLNRLNRDAFGDFAADEALALPLDGAAILAWFAGLRVGA